MKITSSRNCFWLVRKKNLAAFHPRRNEEVIKLYKLARSWSKTWSISTNNSFNVRFRITSWGWIWRVGNSGSPFNARKIHIHIFSCWLKVQRLFLITKNISLERYTSISTIFLVTEFFIFLRDKRVLPVTENIFISWVNTYGNEWENIFRTLLQLYLNPNYINDSAVCLFLKF